MTAESSWAAHLSPLRQVSLSFPDHCLDSDGTLQLADEGQPLYTYAKDKKPGDVKGDNVGKVWHVAK
jgi:hypothetical protein